MKKVFDLIAEQHQEIVKQAMLSKLVGALGTLFSVSDLVSGTKRFSNIQNANKMKNFSNVTAASRANPFSVPLG